MARAPCGVPPWGLSSGGCVRPPGPPSSAATQVTKCGSFSGSRLALCRVPAPGPARPSPLVSSLVASHVTHGVCVLGAWSTGGEKRFLLGASLCIRGARGRRAPARCRATLMVAGRGHGHGHRRCPRHPFPGPPGLHVWSGLFSPTQLRTLPQYFVTMLQIPGR